jgi:hypothetical protein
MDKLPKKQQEYFDRLKKSLSSADEQEFADLVRQKDPVGIKRDLSQVLGQHVRENYDNPLEVFEKKKILETVPVEYMDLPENIKGKYNVTKDKILLNKVLPELDNAQTGTLLHELGHKNDRLSGFTASEKFDPLLLKKVGAEAAEEAFSKHHKSGFFEKEALMSLLKNKKLATLAPLLKATGIGAMGLTAAGIGNKAMAGDFKGATSDVGELAYDVLEPSIVTAAAPTMMGNSELPQEEMERRSKFNLLRKKLGE